MLVTSGRENALRLWEAATGTELRQIIGPNALLTWARFSPDGKSLAALSVSAAGNGGGALRLWDAATGKEIRRWELPQLASLPSPRTARPWLWPRRAPRRRSKPRARFIS
jgi:WD40 repeat protein